MHLFIITKVNFSKEVLQFCHCKGGREQQGICLKINNFPPDPHTSYKNKYIIQINIEKKKS